MTLKQYGEQIYNNAVEHGFYENTKNKFGGRYDDPIWLSNRLMLIVSELSEGLEGIRNDNFSDEPKSGGLGEELADAAIRLFDLAYSVGIDLDKAVERKMKYNESRPYKHGRKAL